MEKLRIGYVGIGLMGMPMTLRLLQLGYSVTVFDIASERTDLACASGAKRSKLRNAMGNVEGQ